MYLGTKKIAVIGQRYVGLSLTIEFWKRYKVLGFDINQSRIDESSNGLNRTNNAGLDELKLAISLATKAI
jgi:UDP-N-acetyl-D-galactosamine dehydrogenase